MTVADDEEDTLFDDVSAMADRLGLEGKEKERYIHQSMTRGGYRAIPSYVRQEEEDKEDSDDDDGFFGSGRRRREPRDRPRGGRPRQPRADDDWYS